ncbi:MAG: dTDP-4-dehydrorhamnose 3,5-epimerase [Bacteroidetes bacterium]|nr:dTDP-4-dehydrorhamnose 3,5-epimerase [Bacteroidota bacterium]
MRITKTEFDGLLLFEPEVHHDSRGYFLESYNKESYRTSGIDLEFVQDNQSFSKAGTLRGLHFQKAPYAQTKLVQVLIGKVQDVVVDLRPDQPTYKQYFSIILDAEKYRQLLVPKGFAHGFLVLSRHAVVLYKTDQVYRAGQEGGINYADKDLSIPWLSNPLIVSERDQQLPILKDLNNPF